VPQIHPWLALGVFAFTSATDAVYVLFDAAVSLRRRLSATIWNRSVIYFPRSRSSAIPAIGFMSVSPQPVPGLEPTSP
jgi:hypothetical protein